MGTNKYVQKMPSNGRIVISQSFREALKLDSGSDVLILQNGNELILMSAEALGRTSDPLGQKLNRDEK